MGIAINIVDESMSGDKIHRFTIEDLTENVTVRELIRARIYQEVQDYNRKRPEVFNGLVQPADSEKILNGYRQRKVRPIDWEKQYEEACAAFQTNGFFILVDDKQVEELDEKIEVRADSQVSFVKLVPLVGG